MKSHIEKTIDQAIQKSNYFRMLGTNKEFRKKESMKGFKMTIRDSIKLLNNAKKEILKKYEILVEYKYEHEPHYLLESKEIKDIDSVIEFLSKFID